MKSRIKNEFLIGLLGAIIFLCSICVYDSCFALWATGNWAPNGTPTNCSFPQIYQRTCNPFDGGGSFHIYKADGRAGPVRYFDYSLMTQPLDSNGLPIIVGNETNYSVSTYCEEHDYAWYAAYGFDGRWNGYGTSYIHWGPAQWHTGIAANTDYNNGGLDYSDASSAMSAGTLKNGTPITAAAAVAFYREWANNSNVTYVPYNVGWFCIDRDAFGFFGRARVLDKDDNVKASTGWVQENTKVDYSFHSNNSGAVATYLLEMKAEQKNTTSKYKRFKNGVEFDDTYVSRTFPNRKKTEIGRGTWTLSPGAGDLCWSINFKVSTDDNNKEYAKVCANALMTKFNGGIAAYGDKSGNNTHLGTKWGTGSETQYINNCEYDEQCKVTFQQAMGRSGSYGAAYYYVYNGNTLVASGTFNPNSFDNIIIRYAGSKNYYIKPGGTTCETLYYYNNNGPDSKLVGVGECVNAIISNFQGKADVKGGYSTGWNASNKEVVQEFDSGNNGIKKGFKLSLRRTPNDSGRARVPYRIREDGVIKPDYVNWVKVDPGTDANGKSEETNEDVTIMPGASKCFSVDFQPASSSNSSVYARACAKAKESTFKGAIATYGDNNNGTTYLSFNDTSEKTESVIANCSATSGCKATFQHAIIKSGSLGTTDYVVSVKSNLHETHNGVNQIDNNDNIQHGTTDPNSFDYQYIRPKGTTTYTLYPGMVVCETLKYKPSNKPGTADTTVTACISANGDAQGNNTLLDIKTKNESVTKYNSYTDDLIYAKPGDLIRYQVTYKPRLQYTAYIKAEKLKVGNAIKPTSGINTLILSSALYYHFPTYSWKNAFRVKPYDDGASERGNSAGFKNTGVLSHLFTYNAGDASEKNEPTRGTYKVVASDVSRTLKEQTLTNYDSYTKYTPTSINFSQSGSSNGGYNTAVMKFDNASDTVDFAVPYNYETGVTIPDDRKTVNAAESDEVTAEISIKKKRNYTTTNHGYESEAYATISAPTTMRLIGFVKNEGISTSGERFFAGTDFCGRYRGTVCQVKEFNDTNPQTFNKNGNMSGSVESRKASFNIPDVEAGTEFCVAAAIYPSTSGSDTNLLDEGNDRWNISDAKCFTVAKKPSMQVWGGGIYINNGASNVETSTSIKNNLKSINGYEYNIKSSNGTHVFGSWAEQALIATGDVKGLGSGASMGYFSYGNGLFPNPTYKNTASGDINPGGSYEESLDFCLRSPLSMANASGLKAGGRTCKNANGFVGSISGSGSSNVDNDRNSIINTLINNGVSSKSTYCSFNGNTILGSTEGYGDNEGELRDKDCKATKTLPLGTTKIIHVKNKGDVTISSDLQYTSGPYNALSDIPKLIIYSTGNININCNVGRIDAVLIADGNVDTCPVEKDEDRANREYSNQLIINGAIIAKNLKLNRTYGAAAGVNSIIPAEIVKYDATLYLWGAREAEMAQSGGLTDAYTHELPPRY